VGAKSFLTKIQEGDLDPKQLMADFLYGSDENVETANA